MFIFTVQTFSDPTPITTPENITKKVRILNLKDGALLTRVVE